MEGGKHPQPHHHGDDGEEVPVALDSGEAERKHVSEENHGWTEADSTQDLRERREKDSRTQWTGVWKRSAMIKSSCGTGSTDHSGEVAGGEHVFRVEAEEDDVHAGQDEVVEGDVHGCLTAPVSRRYETRDPQRGATLDLRRKIYKSTHDGDREECWTEYFMSQIWSRLCRFISSSWLFLLF